MLSKIRSCALNFLARREHSKLELQRKLGTKGFGAHEIAKLLQELVNEKLQSDDRFTESYINMRSSKGFGPLRIKGELEARGIDRETIEKHLDENDTSWFDLAKAIRKKKFGEKVSSDLHHKAQQIRFLYYKGFTNEQIKKII